MFPRFIRLVSFICNSFLLIVRTSIIHCMNILQFIYILLLSIWTASRFWLLGVKATTDIFVCTVFISLKYVKVELQVLKQMDILCFWRYYLEKDTLLMKDSSQEYITWIWSWWSIRQTSKKDHGIHGQQKSPKCTTWMRSQKGQNDLCLFLRQTIQYHGNPSLCPN